jgi:DNA adenine methylase
MKFKELKIGDVLLAKEVNNAGKFSPKDYDAVVVEKNNPLIKTPTCKPFIKWAGGKRSLLPKLAENLPKNFTKYCEPFVGGGALMFHLLTTHSHIEEVLINDSNPDLMITYRVIQQYVTKLINVLTKVQSDYYQRSEDERRKYFVAVREQFNTTAKTFDYSSYGNHHVTRAAYVIFLNKTCFNGLWRVRKSDGGFNTPFGKYANPLICDKHNLELVSQKLQKVFIRSGDYKECSYFIDASTLVYFDPPYIPASETADFVGYTKGSWGLFDNLSLSEFIRSQHLYGAKILLSSSVTANWDNLEFMQKIEVKAKRSVACKVESRDGCKELILRNY